MTEPIHGMPHEPPPKIQKSLETKAEQIPSKGKLLPSSISNFLTTLVHFFSFRRVKVYFTNKRDKEEILHTLVSEISPKESKQTHEIKSILSSFALEDLKKIQKFKSKIPKIIQHFQTFYPKPVDQLKALKNTLVKFIDNPNFKFFEYPEKVNAILHGRLQEKDIPTFLNFFLTQASSKFIEDFNAFLKEVHDIKMEQKPGSIILSTDQTPKAKKVLELFTQLMDEVPNFLIEASKDASQHKLILEIYDATLLLNSQILEENFSALVTPFSSERFAPFLRPRIDGSPYSLHNEFHLNQSSIEIYITDPETQATTTMQLPFRKIPHLKDEDLLELLKNAKDSKEFEKSLESYKPEEKNIIHYAISKFIREAEEKLLQAIFRLDAQRTGSFSSFESEAITAFKNEQTAQNAIAAMTTKTIFALPDSLSLLPVAQPEFKKVATIENAVLKNAKDALLKNESPTFKMDVLTGLTTSTCNVTLEGLLIKFDTLEFPLFEITTRIEGKETLVRRTYYPVEKGKTVEEVIGAIYSSRLLERDLLLAKAEYMENVII